MIIVSPFFPQIYNTSDDVKYIAAWIIRVLAVCMPLNAFMNSTYFTLRSGGKTIVTFLFDSFYIWVVDIPAAIFAHQLYRLEYDPCIFLSADDGN